MNLGVHPSLEVEPDGMDGAELGAFLRASRLRRGDDLRQVSKVLRIRYVYLEAIEEGHFDVLPGNTYTIGFIRTYSEYLGLDSESIIRRLREEGAVSTYESELRFPTIIPDHGIPGSAIVVIGLFVAVVGYGSWYFVSARDSVVNNTVPPVSQKSTVPKQTVKSQPAPVPQKPLVEPISAVAAPAKLPAQNAEDPEPYKVPSARENASPVSAQEIIGSTETAITSKTLIDQSAPEANTSLARTTEATLPDEPSSRVLTMANNQGDEGILEGSNSNNVEAEVISQTSPRPTTAEPMQYPATIANVEATQNTDKIITKVMNTEDTPAGVVIEPNLVQATFDDNAPDTLSKLPDRTDQKVGTISDAGTSSNRPNKTEDEVAALSNAEAGSGNPDQANKIAAPKADTTTSTMQKNKTVNLSKSQPLKSSREIVSRITLTAKGDSWIQVRDISANQLIISKVLLKGHSYEVPNRQGLSLMTGNAGALDISVDGVIVPAIGELGEIRRKVLLEAEPLRQGRAIVQ